MTRLEWFDLQPKYVQDKFKANCNGNNSSNIFFEWWIKQDNKNGIMGAFGFIDNAEGWDFWYDIHSKMKEFSKFVKVNE
jgi:hypothetical protein